MCAEWVGRKEKKNKTVLYTTKSIESSDINQIRDRKSNLHPVACSAGCNLPPKQVQKKHRKGKAFLFPFRKTILKRALVNFLFPNTVPEPSYLCVIKD